MSSDAAYDNFNLPKIFKTDGRGRSQNLGFWVWVWESQVKMNVVLMWQESRVWRDHWEGTLLVPQQMTPHNSLTSIHSGDLNPNDEWRLPILGCKGSPDEAVLPISQSFTQGYLHLTFMLPCGLPTAKCHKNAQIMIQKNGENHTMIVHSATINCGNNVAAIRNQSKTRKPFKSGLFIFPDRTKSIKLINPCIFPGGWFFLRQIFTFRTSWGGLNKFSCLRISYARELLPQHKQMICPVICWKLRRD